MLQRHIILNILKVKVKLCSRIERLPNQRDIVASNDVERNSYLWDLNNLSVSAISNLQTIFPFNFFLLGSFESYSGLVKSKLPEEEFHHCQLRPMYKGSTVTATLTSSH